MIAFTIDIDWAPEAVIDDTLNLFKTYDTKCTLFVTHKSDVIQACDRSIFEIGIHPNFNPQLNGQLQKRASESVDELLELYPESKGIRSHSMTQSTLLLNMFKDKGLLYDSNHFLPYQFQIKPFFCWNGLLRIPYNWEDDIHWMYGKNFKELEIESYNQNSFFVLDFHPVHIFINSESEKTYLNAKEHYHNVEHLKLSVNKNSMGTRDYLIKTLNFVKSNNFKTYKLLDIYEMATKSR